MSTKRNNINALGVCIGMMMSQSVLAIEPTANNSFIEAIQGGKPLIQFRGRYEYVDQEDRPNNAHAYSLHSLIGWHTLPFYDVSIRAQLVDLTQLNHRFYDNDKGQGLPSPYPTVPHPHITDINQLYLEYIGLPKTKVRLGRQIMEYTTDCRMATDSILTLSLPHQREGAPTLVMN